MWLHTNPLKARVLSIFSYEEQNLHSHCLSPTLVFLSNYQLVKRSYFNTHIYISGKVIVSVLTPPIWTRNTFMLGSWMISVLEKLFWVLRAFGPHPIPWHSASFPSLFFLGKWRDSTVSWLMWATRKSSVPFLGL